MTGSFAPIARASSVALATMMALGHASASHAQSPPERSAPLDLVRGPLITSSRITGLGGAFVGIAEGIDGIYRNPAALANRNERSTSWFDIDVTLDWLFVSSDRIDWDGDTRPLSEAFDFRAVNLGLVLQFGPLGLGLLATTYGWEGPGFTVAHVDFLFGLGWSLADGALIVGVGATVAALAVTTGFDEASEATELSGQGGDLGVLWRPPGADWRLGARFRSGVRVSDSDGLGDDEGQVPWQLALGWSSYFSAGGRRYNPPLRSEVATPRDRRYLLLSTELVLSGETHGRSLESLVAASPRPSGEHLSLALHIGAEGEVIHDRLRSRVGAYLEPVRVSGGQDVRPHVTGGMELHLFELLFDWKVFFGFDLAPGWENVSIGVGFWK